MKSLQDKILGCWFGMAVGDAMGMAAKGLKPETVKQCFGAMDDFKDVRKFLGKGVRHYRMQGLYGVQTQIALAVCDCVLKNKKASVVELSSLLLQLATGGPEHGLGVFRHAESPLHRALASLPERVPLLPTDQYLSGYHFPSLAVPIALFHQKDSDALTRQCMDTCLLMSRNPMEVIGSAVTGFLVTRFLALDPKEGEAFSEKESQSILAAGVDICERAERVLKERYPEIWDESGEQEFQSLRMTLQGVLERLHLEEGPLFDWICENASGTSKNKITHPAQNHVLTLIPLALLRVIKGGNEFAPILTRSLNMGKEAPLLGTLVGAWSGALLGFDKIPQRWKSGLVNSREIKARGEALFLRRFPKGLKDLQSMELALTQKESDDSRKFSPKTTRKVSGRGAPVAEVRDDGGEESEIPRKEDRGNWRKFQKDKTRMKRDRRRNLKLEPDEE
jgi:ADP-ribosylglycohydrolase